MDHRVFAEPSFTKHWKVTELVLALLKHSTLLSSVNACHTVAFVEFGIHCIPPRRPFPPSGSVLAG